MKNRTVIPLGLLFLLCQVWWQGTAGASPSRKSLYALKPLESIGMTKTKVDATDQLLHSLFGSIEGVDLIPLRKIQRAMDSRRGSRLSVCGAEADCMADFGKLVNAPVVIGGDMSRVGRGFALSLKLVDTRSEKVKRRVSVIVSGSQEKRKKELLEAGYRLLAPERHTGKLLIEVDVPKAKIYIDGQLAAESPAAAVTVKAGAHNLRVTHPSYHDYLRFVTVPFREKVSLSVNLKAFPIVTDEMRSKRRGKTHSMGKGGVRHRPLPWYRKWYVTLSIGLGAAVLAGTATALAIALSEDGSLRRDVTVVLRP